MNAQVDSGPTEECGDDEENDSITREPIREEGRHHKRKSSMGAGKTWVENLSRTSGKFRGHLQKQKRSLALNQKFEAIDDCGLDGIKKNKMTENSSLFGQNPAKKDEKDDCKMASQIRQPGQDLI